MSLCLYNFPSDSVCPLLSFWSFYCQIPSLLRPFHHKHSTEWLCLSLSHPSPSIRHSSIHPYPVPVFCPPPFSPCFCSALSFTQSQHLSGIYSITLSVTSLYYCSQICHLPYTTNAQVKYLTLAGGTVSKLQVEQTCETEQR